LDLPAPGFAAQEQVALGQGHGDLGAVLVLAHRDRLPQRQPVSPGQRPRRRDGIGQRVAAEDDHAGVAGAGRVADHPDLADPEEGGDPLGLGLQIRHLTPGGHADPELLAGPGEPTAGNSRDAVVAGGQLGMATGQRPPPAQMRAEQGMSQRLPGPGDHGHHERGRDDDPLGALAAQPVPQPPIGHRHQPEQRELQPVGPGRPQQAVEQPVARRLPDHRGGDDRRGLVEGAPADRLAPGRRPILAAPAVHDPTPTTGSASTASSSAWSAASTRAAASSRRAAGSPWMVA
jgi:hypothetical protein